MPDSVAARASLSRSPPRTPAWVGGGYRRNLVEHAARLGIDMEIVQRPTAQLGFIPLPRRWAVERTQGWLMFHRRLARDYEALPTSSEAMIHHNELNQNSPDARSSSCRSEGG